MKKIKGIIFLSAALLILILSSCKEDDETAPPSSAARPNILLIIADDLGKDAISPYLEGSIKPNTPHIDGIRTGGITFNNLWVNPTCTPTRASLITGKYGYRSGVRQVGDELSPNETTLHKYIKEQTDNSYSTALIGKWHLSGSNSGVNPESFGIDYYKGVIRGSVNNYYQWQLSEDGTTSMQSEYVTEAFTDFAIDWLNEQSEPWFLWLAYNAPHTPFHVPPSEMHSQGDLPSYEEGNDPTPYYMAAIEAMDYQIGRLLNNISPEERDNTVIIFLGDNGTPGSVAQSPYSPMTSKGSLYQGGINVPMFISGKNVSRSGLDNNLVTGTDFFATISELAGIDVSEIHDSKSFKALLSQDTGVRDYQYTEISNDTEESYTIRNTRYKLLIRANGIEELYDLNNNPYEQNDLLEGTLSAAEATAKSELEAELLNIRN